MKNLKRKLLLVVASVLFCMSGWAQVTYRTDVRESETFSVQFEAGASYLLLGYKNNQQTLSRFIAQVKAALDSKKYEKVQVRIAKYSTGSGALTRFRILNDQRVEKLTQYLQETGGLSSSVLSVEGGGEKPDELQLSLVTEEQVEVKVEMVVADAFDAKANNVSSIHFKVGKSNLELNFKDNEKTL